MLLAIDVGNTNITIGAFRGEKLLKLWRLATDLKKTADEYGAAISAVMSRPDSREIVGEKIEGLVYGSVVPALSPVIESVARSYFDLQPVAVTTQSDLGIRLKVDQPREVGVDRILNALAVFRLYGAPAVVLDFGTATTFDCVSARGDYLGGAILLGPALAARALAEYTAQLPRVEIEKPRKIIGTNTVECIQAGLYYGYLGMIERVLSGTLQEMRSMLKSRSIRVIATGGLAGLFTQDLPQVRKVIPDMTLQGLRLAYETLTLPSPAKRARG